MDVNLKLKSSIIAKFGTQSDFADVVNEDETYISKIIRNRRKLPFKKQKQWAKVLDQTSGELFKIWGEKINE